MQPNNEPAGNWGYRQENTTPVTAQPLTAGPAPEPIAYAQPAQTSVTWTASEFIAHHKDAGWYALVGGAGFLLGAVVYILTRDIISTGAIFIVLVLFVIISANKPRQLTYSVDEEGISIGEKFYPYTLFKSFAVVKEGAISNINLVPLKRFMPEIAVYYAPPDEARILDVLANSLPNDQKSERITDRFMKRIRF